MFYICQLTIFVAFIFYIEAFVDIFGGLFNRMDAILRKSPSEMSQSLKQRRLLLDAIGLEQKNIELEISSFGIFVHKKLRDLMH